MKAEELIGKTEDELKKTLGDLKKQQFNLRFQLSQGQLDNTSQMRKTRRDVARVQTFLGALRTGKPLTPKAAANQPAKSAKADSAKAKKADSVKSKTTSKAKAAEKKTAKANK